MKKGLRVEATGVFRPRVTPDPTMMELLQKKLEAFSYVPEDGLHRDKIQLRCTPRSLDRSHPWLRVRSA